MSSLRNANIAGLYVSVCSLSILINGHVACHYFTSSCRVTKAHVKLKKYLGVKFVVQTIIEGNSEQKSLFLTLHGVDIYFRLLLTSR